MIGKTVSEHDDEHVPGTDPLGTGRGRAISSGSFPRCGSDTVLRLRRTPARTWLREPRQRSPPRSSAVLMKCAWPTTTLHSEGTSSAIGMSSMRTPGRPHANDRRGERVKPRATRMLDSIQRTARADRLPSRVGSIGHARSMRSTCSATTGRRILEADARRRVPLRVGRTRAPCARGIGERDGADVKVAKGLRRSSTGSPG